MLAVQVIMAPPPGTLDSEFLMLRMVGARRPLRSELLALIYIALRLRGCAAAHQG
jgi:hypothetical protein